MDLHLTVPMKTAVANPSVSYLLGLSEIRQIARLNESRDKPAPLRAIGADPVLQLRGHFVASPFLNRQALHCGPTRARDRAPVQAGNRTARPQSDGQDPRQPYRRAGSRARPRDGSSVNWPTCWRTSWAVTATCCRPSRLAPRRWKMRLRRMPRSQVQRQLVGAYFLNEYSFEASALFNPSIVAHPDQSGTPEGSLRFILSLRAVGEGHVSSLTFRSGLVAADGTFASTRRRVLLPVPILSG